MELWGVTITSVEILMLIVAVGLSLSFEFVNGFHDTANAVATVIYTNTLKPTYAVMWSGLWNFIGALIASGAVAYGIVSLLPVELIMNSGSAAGFAMVFAILVSAIIWNVGTWYLGLPASSSHTMIGAIMGVGIGNAISNGHYWLDGLNIDKVKQTGLILLISPLVGFGASFLLLLALKAWVPFKELFEAPQGKTPPPLWIRIILIITCTGVSYSHGSNDAQKGMGLLMLILIGIIPGAYAIDMTLSAEKIQDLSADIKTAQVYFQQKAGTTTMDKESALTELKAFKKDPTEKTYAALVTECQAIEDQLAGIKVYTDLKLEDRTTLRTELFAVSGAIGTLTDKDYVSDDKTKESLKQVFRTVNDSIRYIPWYVKAMVALALGLGTMIGWKRVVVTVGEKIGKAHLTYAQGASAEFVAMCTVIAADFGGAPVSTTHVLSSGVAGTMAANRSGLQSQTLINILLAWVLTLPVCVFLGAGLFSGALYLIFHVMGG